MTFIGNRVLVNDQVKVISLDPMTVLRERENLDTETDTHREKLSEVKAEVRVTRL